MDYFDSGQSQQQWTGQGQNGGREEVIAESNGGDAEAMVFS